MHTIDAGYISLPSKNPGGLSFKYIYINPRIDGKPITQEQLLRRAWAVTGNSMKLATRNYTAHGKQQSTYPATAATR